MTGEVLLALRFLLGVSLFAFLGFVLWLLWNDLKIQASMLASRKIPALSLIVETENESPLIHNFQQAEIAIGRDPACECILSDEAVSTHHARLTYHRNQWWLEDLDSRNGTKLNQELLAMPTVVVSGDRILCGRTNLTIVINPT